LDAILKPEVGFVENNLPTAEFELIRLSKMAGEPVIITLHGLTYSKCQQLREMEQESEIHILLAGCDDLRDPSFLSEFAGATPAESVKKLLLAGEIAGLAKEVEKLSGYRNATIDEVKND
jgi:hypothetical protein